MSERSTVLLLSDIEHAIGRILEYTENLTFDQYKTDRKTKDAAERNFEIIGEAAGRLPKDYREYNKDVEWRIIKDFRNVVIHDYFGINDKIVWDAIQQHLPDLLLKIRKLISVLSEQNNSGETSF